MTSDSEAFQKRIAIVGNSGSGKTVLARRLGKIVRAPATSLDLLHWHNGEKRDEAEATRMVADLAKQPAWIIEGVYGWLVQAALVRATTFVWLDLPWAECLAGIKTRHSQRKAGMPDDAALLQWAEAYWDRQTSSSFKGHERIFRSFPGAKLRFCHRMDVERWISEVEAGERGFGRS